MCSNEDPLLLTLLLNLILQITRIFKQQIKVIHLQVNHWSSQFNNSRAFLNHILKRSQLVTSYSSGYDAPKSQYIHHSGI